MATDPGAVVIATDRSLPGRIVSQGVRILPRDYRPRYQVELTAELKALPKDQRLSYALHVLLHSVALRIALTTYRPTIGETLMATNSSQFNNSKLRRRQQGDDVGHAVLGSHDRVTSKRRWKVLGVPVFLMVLGVILGIWGPLPGLGMFLLMGAAMSLVAVAIALFNDVFS